jgi:SAM-dependent methyltransferase|tara:strand:+ start:1764 stop:2477 length:714 start_codon:yes stop_codon:yes gene_type:complete
MGKNNLEYNFDTAFHYKAYRPPLHTIILDNCIGNLLFEKALDVGCGLGHSSIALTNFCDKVIGYDPSEPMIQQAKKHERVNYLSNLKYLKDKYNLLCFFGSLFYIDKEMLEFYFDYLVPDGNILCCDFEVNYESVIEDLKISESKLNYDHTKNLDAYNNEQNILIKSEQFEVEFDCQNYELVHLLLTEKNIKDELLRKFYSKNFYQQILNKFEKIYPSNKVTLKTKMFYSYYKKNSN